MEIMSDPENPVLKLDAKGVLDFIDTQSEKERKYFDRLLKWFAAGIAVVVAVFAVLGIQNWNQVRKISEDIRAETKKQLSAAVNEELDEGEDPGPNRESATTKDRGSVSGRYQQSGCRRSLNTPQRQRLLEVATQRQVDVLTRHLQDRERILSLGDRAITWIRRILASR